MNKIRFCASEVLLIYPKNKFYTDRNEFSENRILHFGVV